VDYEASEGKQMQEGIDDINNPYRIFDGQAQQVTSQIRSRT